ncbi:MAG: class I adenylate-forming enzyme family protein [Pseudoruegeria sp.]
MHESHSMGSDPCNIGTIIAKMAETDPDALCVEQGGVCYTRADVIQSAQALAVFFKEQGVEAGASIAIVVVDQLRGIQACIALWSLGAATLFLDPRQRIDELRTAQDRADVEAIFTDSKSFARRGGFGLLPADITAVKTTDALSFPSGSCDAVALIRSSSGTTGLPRFRRVSHRTILSGMQSSAVLLGSHSPFPAIIVGSLAFGAILSHWMKLLIHGKFILALPLVFKTSELHQALLRTEIQSVGLPPVLIEDLLAFHKDNAVEIDRPIYPHLRRMTSVGGPITPENLVQAYQVLTPSIKNLYSMSGIGAVSALSGGEILEKPNSVGKPFPSMTVRIESKKGELCKTGQVGRIVVNAGWKDSAVPIDTGDLGWLDEEGYLFVHGRSAQIATRKSINVGLADIELDVKGVAGIRDCLAFCIQSDGSADDFIYLAVEAETPLVVDHIRSILASYRWPDKILVRAQLPRNAASKISLRDLKRVATEKETSFVDF